MESLDSELANQMYEAITSRDITYPCRTEQVQHIIRYINTLTLESRREIARLITQRHGMSVLHDCSGGCAINIASVSDDTILIVYKYIYTRVNPRSS